MTDEQRRLQWVARRREARRLKLQQTGDSPEKAAQHHTPRGDVIDLMLNAGGVTRENRFRKDKMLNAGGVTRENRFRKDKG